MDAKVGRLLFLLPFVSPALPSLWWMAWKRVPFCFFSI